MSLDTITCVTPPANHAFISSYEVSVIVSFHGQSQELSYLRITYFPASHISHISPSFGPTKGGNILHIIGGGFISGAEVTSFCLFNDIFAEARIINETLAKCVSPGSTEAGKVGIRLSFNVGYDTTSMESYFTYVLDPIILELSPNSVLTLGGGLISVRGNNFSKLGMGSALCLISDKIVQAVIVNDTFLTFRAPSFTSEAQHPVLISLN